MLILKQFRACLAVLFGILLLGAVSCRSADSGRTPGWLSLRLNANPTTLDPAHIVDVPAGSIAAKIFNGLVRFDEDLRIVPDLAQSWSVSADHTTYTFRLKKGVRFSHGREVTAHDFRYSFERVLNPKTRAPITWALDRIRGAKEMLAGAAEHASGIRVKDDYTLVITLERPFGPFLSLLGMTTAYVVPREEVERLGEDFGTKPVGTGPYALVEWRHGQGVSLAARQDYFEGKPGLRGIIYRIIPEDLTAVMEFETGRLDALQVPAAEFRRYAEDPRWKGLLFGKPGLNTYYLGLNCSRPPFDNVDVRRAMNMAIDRKRILETIYEKRGVIASGPIPPALRKFELNSNEDKGYPYDAEQARRILRKAGLEGTEINIFISADAEVLDIAEVIQYYLSRAGLRARITQLDWSAFKEKINTGEADAFWLSWWADYPDPENFFYPLFHSANAGPAGNRSLYKDEEFDKIIEAAQRTADERLRYALYRKARERLIQNAPWVFMWHRADYTVIQPWVKNFRIYPIYSIDKGMDIGLRNEEQQTRGLGDAATRR
jgi:peptide/nickel transport system substrate-binding protein/oligopeptide transport system substrate-binding protein